MVDPGRDHGLHGRRQQRRRQRAGVGREPLPPVQQHPGRLDDEERVPAGVLRDPLGGRLVQAFARVPRELRRVVERERLQVEVDRVPAPAAPAGTVVEQRVPGGADHEQRDAVGLASPTPRPARASAPGPPAGPRAPRPPAPGWRTRAGARAAPSGSRPLGSASRRAPRRRSRARCTGARRSASPRPAACTPGRSPRAARGAPRAARAPPPPSRAGGSARAGRRSRPPRTGSRGPISTLASSGRPATNSSTTRLLPIPGSPNSVTRCPRRVSRAPSNASCSSRSSRLRFTSGIVRRPEPGWSAATGHARASSSNPFASTSRIGPYWTCDRDRR